MTVTINGTTGYTGPIGAIGDLSTTGNTTLGDAAGDTLTINGSTTTFTQGTANGVAYLNGSKNLTTGTALVFDGTNLGVASGNVTVASGKGFVLSGTPTTGMFPDDQVYGLKLQSEGAVRFMTNGANERARFNANAAILCLAGGNTSATGTGIAFPASQSASSDANTLDDYEEGTCTLVLSDSDGNNATMGSVNVFRYVKIGQFVNVSGTFNWTSTSALNTSRTRITGLPFAADSTYNMRWPTIFGSSSPGSFNVTRSELAFGIDFGNSFIWGTLVTGNNQDNALNKTAFGSSGVLYGLEVVYSTTT
jgi:hypothetical protein